MLTETISIEVASEVARFYKEASPEDKKNMQFLAESWIEYYAKADPEDLDSIIEEAGREAGRNGLTPEILESLLRDE